MTIKIKIKETGEIKEISARLWNDICNYGDERSFSHCDYTDVQDYICDEYTYNFWCTFDTEITAAERRLQDLKKEYGQDSEEIERLEREIQDQQCDLEDLPYVMNRAMDQFIESEGK